MNNTTKFILFTVGTIFAVVIINAIIFANSFSSNPSLTPYLIVFFGRYMWVIIPAIVILFVSYKKIANKKLSETQKIFMKAAIWAFLIMAFFMLLGRLATL